MSEEPGPEDFVQAVAEGIFQKLEGLQVGAADVLWSAPLGRAEVEEGRVGFGEIAFRARGPWAPA